MKHKMTFTYQTRLVLNPKQEDILTEYASLMSLVEHTLYAEVAKGSAPATLKNEFLKKFKITARQFNAARVSLEGKIDACKTGQKQVIENLKQQIQTINRQIKTLEQKPSKHFVAHQKKRRLAILSHRLGAAEEKREKNQVSLCFGGKKLFHAQFHLEKNGFGSHLEWKKAWEAKRSSEFFVLGSKDETSGNQTCTALLQGNGKLLLRLRLPKSLEEKYGKYLQIPNIEFAYGQQTLLAALNNPEGQAISYRFKKDEKSWKIFASTDLKKKSPDSLEGNGVIGIDLNVDHIAYVETDRYGNPLTKQVQSWDSYGKTKKQLKAITGDICKQIIDRAKDTKKLIVIENLDFKTKKMTLKENTKKFARVLSSFAYGLFYSFLLSRAFRHGIEIHRVNPAFTSIIGRVNYAKRYGLSVHLAAALCIARRYQQFSELPCSPTVNIPDGKGGHVAFVLPERNRAKHVWHFWGKVKKKMTTVLAAHRQAKKKSILESANAYS